MASTRVAPKKGSQAASEDSQCSRDLPPSFHAPA